MRRITVLAIALAAVSVAAGLAGIWWGQSLLYLFGSAAVYISTGVVWWIWLARTWDRQLDASKSSKLPRFLR